MQRLRGSSKALLGGLENAPKHPLAMEGFVLAATDFEAV